ncbi:MAG: ATP-binding protein [Candidatus Pacebacteria bacterium]|nr:ATP-binding protein [Candidatus Paceibacterota bacterium]
MLATEVILCTTMIGNAVLLGIVLKERTSPVRITFALYVASILAWTFAIYLNLFLQSTFVEEWIFATAASVLTFQLWFTVLFPRGVVPRKLGAYWPIAIGCGFALLSFYPGALFTSITVHSEGYTTLDTGALSVAYSLFALFYVCAPIALCFRRYRAERSERFKTQLNYLTVAFAIFGFVAVLTNSVLPVFFGIYEFNALGPSLSLIFASTVFYLVGRHDFLDIRRAVVRGVVYSFLIAALIVMYEISLLSIEHNLRLTHLFFPWADDVLEPLSAAIVTLVGVLTIPFLERWFGRFTDHLFFKARYDYAQAVESLSKAIQDSTDFDHLLESIREKLTSILRAEFVEVLLYNNGSVPVLPTFEGDLSDRRLLLEPIRVNGSEIGAILVGEKRSGDLYTSEDAQLLRTLSLHASTALARVQLFMQVRSHATELEHKVRERTEELREAHERERQMMLDIAHGLQTPLAVLQTQLEKLHSAENEMPLESLEQSLGELSSTMQDLTKLAHLEHQHSMQFELLDLSKFAHELCDELEILATPRTILIVRTIAPNIFIHADARELRTAIMNIAHNSVKYMRENGRREIRIRLSQRSTGTRLSISDTGIGISATDLPHVFDRFYRAYATQTVGSGLGLAIAKVIVEKHGGAIGIQSTEAGTTVTIEFSRS